MSEENTPVPQAGTTQIDNIILERFEALVYRRDVKMAAVQLMDILNKLYQGADFVKYRNDDSSVMTVLYTRLAAAIAMLMTDPQFQMSQEGFAKIALNHAVLQAVFDVSAFNTSDFVIPALVDNPLETDPSKLKFGDPRNMAKFFLLRALDSRVEVNFEEFFSKAAPTALPVFIGMLTHMAVLTPGAFKARETLLGLGRYFEKLAVPDVMLRAVSDVFMYTSYGVRRDKHKLKQHLSKMLRRACKDRGVVLPTDKDLAVRRAYALTEPIKPVMLIPLEHFGSFHAMYRIYAPSVTQLRQRFHLVACVRRSQLDSEATKLFDEVLAIPEGEVELAPLVARINQLAPDMVWYPSIGMATWWTILSSVRLAPIQCMSFGHPATSYSSAIDYGLVEEDTVGDESLFSEKLVIMPEGTLQFAPRLDQTPVSKDTLQLLHDKRVERLETSWTIRVAITSTIMKLNVPFIEALKRIRAKVKEAGYEVEFHFFPNMIGLWRWQATKILREWLPNCLVWPRYDYATYISRLAQCDLHFSPFPFGGTNSNIDSLTVGLPILTLTGPEIHESFDGVMLNRLGLGELVCNTVEEYEDKAVCLITEAVMRNGIAACVREADVQQEFFGERRGAAKGAFVDTMWAIYESHEEMQAVPGSVHYQHLDVGSP